MNIVTRTSAVGTPGDPAAPATAAAAAQPSVTSALSVTPPRMVKPQTYSPSVRIENRSGVSPPSSGEPKAPVDSRMRVDAA
eukprot:7171532-Prymnesium_polylepis.1